MEETIKDIIDGVPDEPSDAENNEYIITLIGILATKMSRGSITPLEFKAIDVWLDLIRTRFEEIVKP